MPYKMIVFSTGYVESGSLSRVVFKYKHFDNALVLDATPQEVVAHLATSLFLKWWWEESYYAKDYATGELDWNRLHLDSFEAMIRELPMQTADSFGSQDVPCWWPWLGWGEMQNTPLEQTIEIREEAEKLLSTSVDFRLVDYNSLSAPQPDNPNWMKIKELYQQWLQAKDLHWNDFDKGFIPVTVEEYREKLFKSCCRTWGAQP